MLLALLILVLLLQLGDALTTLAGLRRSALTEGNPVAVWLFARLGVLPAVLAMKIGASAIAVGVWASSLPPTAKLGFLTLSALLMIRTVCDNARLAWKHRERRRG